MRIGLNALFLIPGKVGGTEVYIRNLVRHLSRLDNENEYVIFINRESIGVFDEIAPGFKIIVCPVNAENRPFRILWEQFILPFQVLRHRLDLLLSAGMTAPFICPAKSIVVIYDLQHVNEPENFPRFHLLFLRSIIYLSAKSADQVITISEHVKRDIARHYNLAASDIYVTYCAVDRAAFHRRSPVEVLSVRKRYNLPERFILYIASSLPHKNYERLFTAFKRVRDEELGIKLVLVGARDYGGDVILKKISELGLEDDTLFLGWLPFEDIPAIYSASDLFVFPSLHEGFGIPVVEAMACGVPVVCSDIEPLREVAGDAAVFVDPLSPDKIAEGIQNVLKNRDMREGFVKAGLRRAEDFSWDKTALKTIAAIKGCAGRKKA